MVASYRDFENRLAAVATKGSKTEAVRQFVRSNASDTFSMSDLRSVVPNVSDTHAGKLLRDLRDEGIIEVEVKGRNARWRRLRTDF